MAFEPIDNNFVHRNFNDRRAGGNSKNRSVGESLYDPKKLEKIRRQKQKETEHGQFKDQGYGDSKGLGGTKVPRKPKNPKDPMPARAVAIKHEVKGY
jgi:hypothetical protein